jgi:hypothetical protein
MTKIKVTALRENRYEVIVEDEYTSSNHIVEMSEDFYNELQTESSPEEVIRRSFDFLLDREPKEAILQRFNIKVIESFFPEYKEEVNNF